MTTSEKIESASFAEAKSLVRQKLMSDNEWLVRGLMALAARQTEDERQAEDTRYQNKMGFNSSDGKILTGFSRQWREREWFSDKQMAMLRRKLLKYSGQLARIARGEETA